MPDLPLERALGYRLMSSFSGLEAPAEVLAEIKRRALGGFTLFRHHNVDNPAQVRRLTASLQRAARAAGEPPLLIAADQEGGQLVAMAGTTPFPGNMALGAAGSTDLARRTGEAMGRELAALGINVNYAPVCDVNTNPLNPVVGTRAFGSDPAHVSALAAAMIEGLQAAGVAATAKHFPGHGDTATDSHDGLPVVAHDRQRLEAVELAPFRAAVAAGARLVMTAHIAVPAATGHDRLPATLSPRVLRDLLRGQLGFEGVTISDAMEMAAIEQGPRLSAAAAAAAAAGVDLLLLNADPTDQALIYSGLLEAARRKGMANKDIQASARRVLALKAWCAQAPQPALEVVGGAEHRALAAEIAAASITLVRDRARRLPLRLSQQGRLLLVRPELHNLTPADTTSYEALTLADALRAYHPRTEEIVVPLNPSEADIAGVRARAAGSGLVMAATLNAQHHPGQAALVNALLGDNLPVVAVALRLPYDLVAYPTAPTYICTYGLLPPSIHALAQALWGEMSFGGKLPVTLPKH